MRLHEEKKQRNIDPFELIVFKEEQSAHLKQLETQMKQNKERLELETLSVAPSNAYGGYNQQKQKKPKRKVITSLPKYIRDNINVVSFGCGTLPSDNMNMVMTHEFEHAFVNKLKQK